MGNLREEGRAAIEAPDLLVYRDDPPEIRFAECKRADTGDKLNRRQLIGFMLIGAALRCPIDIFVLHANTARSPQSSQLEFDYPQLVKLDGLMN